MNTLNNDVHASELNINSLLDLFADKTDMYKGSIGSERILKQAIYGRTNKQDLIELGLPTRFDLF